MAIPYTQSTISPLRLEAADHKEVARWLDSRPGLLWCHVPNGGKRAIHTAAALKAMGTKRGVPDILVFTPPPKSPHMLGCALELKRPGGKLSDYQKDWLGHLSRLGWAVFACEGRDMAIGWLTQLGY